MSRRRWTVHHDLNPEGRLSAMGTLFDVVDAAWADLLGCSVELLRTQGAHLVPGSRALSNYQVYMARLPDSVLVWCLPGHQATARRVLSTTAVEDLFCPATCREIARVDGQLDLVAVRHSFVDRNGFHPANGAAGERLGWEDPQLDQLRQACGEEDWSQGGFEDRQGALLYGLRDGGRLVAAGNMTDFRGVPADVGIVTHPAHRGQGFARRLVSHMVAEQLSAVGLVRYRALETNVPSLAVARSLGFVARGEHLRVRLAESAGQSLDHV